jgi:flavin reductase (DIM6/NTAB) family NADH-FMN oxidoreductase RutF
MYFLPLLMTLDAQTFRTVMSKFATGVTIVTTRAGEEIHGLTVNAFCSVSLEPMLVLICVDKQAKAHALLEKSGNFAVNLLAADQEHLARRFSTDQLPAAERFKEISHHRMITGAPVLDRSLGFLDCEIVASYPGGDHTIFLGKVIALEARNGHNPLLYFESSYRHLPDNRQL